MITEREKQLVHEAVATLKRGGIVIYPTDTIYGLGCDIFNSEALEKLYRIKKRDAKKPMSIICHDLSNISEYAIIPNYAYRLMKKALPGPYTFILKATKKTPHRFIAKNKTVGIRVPDNDIALEIVRELGNPIITTSVNSSGDTTLADPQELSSEFKNQVDFIIDVGPIQGEPSTVIDVSRDAPVVLREGSGLLAILQQ